jgi:hypothetical protein
MLIAAGLQATHRLEEEGMRSSRYLNISSHNKVKDVLEDVLVNLHQVCH